MISTGFSRIGKSKPLENDCGKQCSYYSVNGGAVRCSGLEGNVRVNVKMWGILS